MLFKWRQQWEESEAASTVLCEAGFHALLRAVVEEADQSFEDEERMAAWLEEHWDVSSISTDDDSDEED